MFQLRLCLALGMTRRELLGRMDSRELTMWAAFAGIEPIGPERQDIMLAQIAHTTYAMNAVGGGRRLKLADFIPWARAARPRQTEDEMKAIFRAAMKARARGK